MYLLRNAIYSHTQKIYTLLLHAVYTVRKSNQGLQLFLKKKRKYNSVFYKHLCAESFFSFRYKASDFFDYCKRI
jgi:hypothetical protein